MAGFVSPFLTPRGSGYFFAKIIGVVIFNMIAYFQAYCLQAVYLPFCLGEKVVFFPELFFKVCGPGFALLSQALGGYFGDDGDDDA